jgi:hypothetical protein
MTSRSNRLDALTARWRRRHDASRLAAGARPPADADRESLAARAFPYRTVEPAAYVAAHGADMIGFTYDDAHYTDEALDAWLREVGRLLRERR